MTSSHGTSSFRRVGAGNVDNGMHVGGFQAGLGAKVIAVEGVSLE
jgi:hypothetical protein